MKVVFLSTVDNHKAGDVRDVADGYARNFLLPRGLVKPATPEQLKALQTQKDMEARREARAQAEADELARRLGSLTLSITARTGAQKRLHGSITAQHVADALKEQHGIIVDRHDVALADPIKKLGTFDVAIHVGHGLSPKLKVTVTEE
ncbi:MAG TPA: 50S ribosomal protein L9 [Chloroflexota bacterium]|nr:50S ribosomal protein L9 [Chloroflexota bacterium]